MEHVQKIYNRCIPRDSKEEWSRLSLHSTYEYHGSLIFQFLVHIALAIIIFKIQIIIINYLVCNHSTEVGVCRNASAVYMYLHLFIPINLKKKVYYHFQKL